MNPSFESKPSVIPAHVVDPGKIILGAGYRQAAVPAHAVPAHVADQGQISMGAGYRLPAGSKVA